MGTRYPHGTPLNPRRTRLSLEAALAIVRAERARRQGRRSRDAELIAEAAVELARQTEGKPIANRRVTVTREHRERMAKMHRERSNLADRVRREKESRARALTVGMEPELVGRLSEPFDPCCTTRALRAGERHGLMTMNAYREAVAEEVLPRGLGVAIGTFVRERLGVVHG